MGDETDLDGNLIILTLIGKLKQAKSMRRDQRQLVRPIDSFLKTNGEVAEPR